MENRKLEDMLISLSKEEMKLRENLKFQLRSKVKKNPLDFSKGFVDSYVDGLNVEKVVFCLININKGYEKLLEKIEKRVLFYEKLNRKQDIQRIINS